MREIPGDNDICSCVCSSNCRWYREFPGITVNLYDVKIWIFRVTPTFPGVTKQGFAKLSSSNSRYDRELPVIPTFALLFKTFCGRRKLHFKQIPGVLLTFSRVTVIAATPSPPLIVAGVRLILLLRTLRTPRDLPPPPTSISSARRRRSSAAAAELGHGRQTWFFFEKLHKIKSNSVLMSFPRSLLSLCINSCR